MKLSVTSTAIPDVLILEPKVFGDSRGFFLESYNQQEFEQATGLKPNFVQDNHSRSAKGVLRGLHFQLPPHAQGKLVRVVSGSVFDVAVDIRRDSPSYGRWIGVSLTAENHRQLWIPPGMAHGFLVTSESADFLYKATSFYSPEHERCIAWNDPTLAIDWPITVPPLISPKDKAGISLSSSTSVVT